ncbi:uncharacterized protein LOC113281227 [Papaver somniferum]|uniref:uncharacterized protein LOC113281227 n=1 Tax=Papaver somniferum TaxID=3469 RepID=UPI000E6FE36A|nr:uncharacterized protein LOC113281227 [Papaver somniferum]
MLQDNAFDPYSEFQYVGVSLVLKVLRVEIPVQSVFILDFGAANAFIFTFSNASISCNNSGCHNELSTCCIKEKNKNWDQIYYSSSSVGGVTRVHLPRCLQVFNLDIERKDKKWEERNQEPQVFRTFYQ